MKNLTLIVWIMQLGISIAVPPAALIWLSVWLQDSFGWGNWIIWVGAALGVLLAVDGLRSSLKAMVRLSDSENDMENPPVSFNDHE